MLRVSMTYLCSGMSVCSPGRFPSEAGTPLPKGLHRPCAKNCEPAASRAHFSAYGPTDLTLHRLLFVSASGLFSPAAAMYSFDVKAGRRSPSISRLGCPQRSPRPLLLPYLHRQLLPHVRMRERDTEVRTRRRPDERSRKRARTPARARAGEMSGRPRRRRSPCLDAQLRQTDRPGSRPREGSRLGAQPRWGRPTLGRERGQPLGQTKRSFSGWLHLGPTGHQYCSNDKSM